MTPKQQRFVAEYQIDGNATQALIRAGGSGTRHGLEVQASRLMRNVEVRAAIASAEAERSKRTAVSADMVVAELAKLGFANMWDFMRVDPEGTPRLDFSTLTRDQAAAIGELTVEEFMDGAGEDADGTPLYRPIRKVKFKLAGKHGPLVDLGKHFGIFRERAGALEDLPDDELAAVLDVVKATRGARGTS